MESKLKKNYDIPLEDEQFLWHALKLGDATALSSLFKKYYRDLFFYGLKLTGNQDLVADTIQDVFATIWETRKKISEVTHVKAYLCAALRNNLLRSNPRDIFIKTENTKGLGKDYVFDISPEEIYLEKETQLENAKIIEDLLANLSPKQREIIYLKFYGNYSNIEISSILSIKQQSVANLLLRTLSLLRKATKEKNSPILNLLLFYTLSIIATNLS